MNAKKCFGFLSGLYLAASLIQSSPALADDYPPALNYDDFTESVLVGNEDGNMYFAKKIRSVHFYTPGRDVQVRTDVVDAKGNILSTKEYVHRYKNGEALGEGDTSVWKCTNRPENKCLMGKNSFKVEPGLYWMIYSENGKIFSAEWFEVRSYKLGEGRFAKGQKYYAYLPTTQMAQIELDPKEDKVNVKVGLAGEKEVGDKYSVTKTLKAELKHNGKAFAATPGKNPHKVNLYPNTTLETVNLSLVKNNSTLKYKDLKPGKYELNISLDGKGYRKFIFEMKDGKIVYQGRQKESTQPAERMIASEKSYWLWNTYTKEPTYTIPTVDLSTP